MATYNKIKIIFHLLIFKLKYKTIKTALNVKKIIQTIENKQKITINDLKYITLKNLRTSIKFHNNLKIRFEAVTFDLNY